MSRKWSQIGRTYRRRLLAVGVIGLLVLTAPCWGLYLAFRIIPDVHARWVRVPFDPIGWKARGPDAAAQRFMMLPSLVRDVRLVGRTVAEVQELLGEPRYVETQEVRPGTVEYIFDIGPERGLLLGDWDWPFLQVVVSTADDRVVAVRQLAGLGVIPMVVTQQE